MRTHRPVGTRVYIGLVSLVSLACSTSWDGGMSSEDTASTNAEVDSTSSGGSGKGGAGGKLNVPGASPTGTFRTSVAFQVPQFHGLEPSLSLSYESGAANGFAGLGWRLSGAPVIERTSGVRGAPQYNANDVYVFDGQELVACTADAKTPSCSNGGTHTTKVDSYSRVAFDSATNTWTVSDKDGKKTVLSPVFGTPKGTFRWAITRVTDTHANTVNYAWACDGNPALDCYLDKISYNGNEVRFYRETRPDTITFASGNSTLQSTRSRLKSVAVFVSGALARAYQLTYGAGSRGRSRLSKVQQLGSDAIVDATGTLTAKTVLPATTFTYSAETSSFSTVQVPTFCGGESKLGGRNEHEIRTGDFNGDGRTDLLCWTLKTGAVSFLLSTGKNSFAPAYNLPESFCATDSPIPDYNGDVYTGDFNGDGRADILCRNNKTEGRIFTRFSNGDGTFQAPIYWTQWCKGFKTYELSAVGDVNLDGRTDLSCETNGIEQGVAFSEGDGKFTVLPSTHSIPPWFLADVNGDGIRDNINSTRRYAGNPTEVWNNGINVHTFLGKPNGTLSVEMLSWGPGNVNFKARPAGDVNGDGKEDIFKNDYTGISTGDSNYIWIPHTYTQVTWWGTGDFNGDGASDLYEVPTNGGVHKVTYGSSDGTVAVVNAATKPFVFTGIYSQWRQPTTADFDGDGRTEFLMNNLLSGESWIISQDGSTGDLLTQVDNGAGGRTAIAYKPSSAYANFNMPLGMVMQTVASITLSDGRGTSGTTNFDYKGGRWSPFERRFMGYAETTAIDASGAKVVTTWLQNQGFNPGRAISVEQYSSTGKLLAKTQSWYDQTMWAGVFRTLLSAQAVSTCDGATCAASRTEYAYDEYGNVTQEKQYGDAAMTGDERTAVTSYVYNKSAYLLDRRSRMAVLSGLGTAGSVLRDTHLSYDGLAYNAAPTRGDATKKELWLKEANRWIANTSKYDSYGNETESADPLSNTKKTTYDATYHVYPLSVERSVDAKVALKSQKEWNYLLGVAKSETNENGDKTLFQYDAVGRLTSESRPLSSSTITSYENVGDPTKQAVYKAVKSGATVLTWTRTFSDGWGRAWKVTSSDNSVKLTDFDGRGLVRRTSTAHNPATGESPKWTQFTYDALAREVRTQRPDNSAHTTTYSVTKNTADPDFRTPRATRRDCNENSVCALYAFDARGNQVLTVEYNHEGTPVVEYRTRASYDLLDQTTALTDALGNRATRQYDSLGRKVAISDPDLGNWKYEYDDAGRLTAQTDARGTVLTFTYDGVARALQTKSGATVLVTRKYDEAGHGSGTGRATSMTDASGSVSWTYDALGRVTAESRVISGTTFTVGQAWDAANRVTDLTYPDGEVVHYTYGADGCQTTVGGYVTATKCNARGAIDTQTLGNGTVLTYAYDPNRFWTTGLIAVTGKATIDSMTYTRDSLGRVRNKTGLTPNDSWDFAYDDLNRLLSATNKGTAAWSESYTYDRIGRLLSKPGVGAFTYSTTAHVHAPCSVGGTSCTTGTLFTYDANGNLTKAGTHNYKYDAENRLSDVDGSVFVYDGDGHRIKAGATVFIGMNSKLLYEKTGSAFTKYYYYGDVRVAKKTSGGVVTYYLSDLIGTTSRLLNASGAVVGHRVTKPFGTEAAVTDAGASDVFGLGGRRKEANGWLKMGVRYMDPARGQFVMPDVGAVASVAAPQSLNRYSYVSNNPVTLVDPSGYAEQFSYLESMAILDSSGMDTPQRKWSGFINPSVSSAVELRAPTMWEDFKANLGVWWNRPGPDWAIDVISFVGPAAMERLGMKAVGLIKMTRSEAVDLLRTPGAPSVESAVWSQRPIAGPPNFGDGVQSVAAHSFKDWGYLSNSEVMGETASPAAFAMQFIKSKNVVCFVCYAGRNGVAEELSRLGYNVVATEHSVFNRLGADTMFYDSLFSRAWSYFPAGGTQDMTAPFRFESALGPSMWMLGSGSSGGSGGFGDSAFGSDVSGDF